jgi:hypothetical protein
MSDIAYKITVRQKDGRKIADDYAVAEEEARAHAAGWTGQRGQLTWVARIYCNGELLATYRRGEESAKP